MIFVFRKIEELFILMNTTKNSPLWIKTILLSNDDSDESSKVTSWKLNDKTDRDPLNFLITCDFLREKNESFLNECTNFWTTNEKLKSSEIFMTNSFFIIHPLHTMTPAELMTQAQQLVKAYDEAVESLEKWQEISDEQIDALIWTESDMWNMISALILMKKTHANRRLIAEKEEEKCMIFVKRLMKKLKVEDRVCDDWKATWKKTRRRQYTDIDQVPKEFLAPVRWSINSQIQKDVKIPWTQIVEWYLAITVK